MTVKIIKGTEYLSLYLKNERTLRCFLSGRKRDLGVILQSNLESELIIAAIGTTISKRKKDFFLTTET